MLLYFNVKDVYWFGCGVNCGMWMRGGWGEGSEYDTPAHFLVYLPSQMRFPSQMLKF